MVGWAHDAAGGPAQSAPHRLLWSLWPQRRQRGVGGPMDQRLRIKPSSGSGKEYNRAVGRSLCLWNLLLFAMYCIVTRTSDYWFPPKPRTSPYVVSAAMIVGLMLIIQGLIENTKTGGRIKQWILNFRWGASSRSCHCWQEFHHILSMIIKKQKYIYILCI